MSSIGSKSNSAVNAASSKALEAPAHPALSYWDINRKLQKLERNYQRDQEKKPAEIESSSIGSPRAAAIGYMVERLKQYVLEIENAYEAEIEAGRVADTAGLWAAVYSQKVLPSVQAKINSLMGNLAFRLMRTGGGGAGEKATIEEAQREFSRLKAGLERKLASACEHAEPAKAAEKPSPHISLTHQTPDLVAQSWTESENLSHSEEYRTIIFKGESFRLTNQQASIVRTLNEARERGLNDVGTRELQKRALCGKISDSFRSGHGPKVWKHLVVPVDGCKGRYKLNLPPREK